jgi:hypothetical protein
VPELARDKALVAHQEVRQEAFVRDVRRAVVRGVLTSSSTNSSSVVIAVSTSELRSGAIPSVRDHGEIQTHGNSSSTLTLAGSGVASAFSAPRFAGS